MGVFGIMLAMLVNIFLKSNTMDLIISRSASSASRLTAYDTQRIKEMFDPMETATASAARR